MEKKYFELKNEVLDFISDLESEKKFRELYDFVYEFIEFIPLDLQIRMALEIILSLGQEEMTCDKLEKVLQQQVKTLRLVFDPNPVIGADSSCYEDLI